MFSRVRLINTRYWNSCRGLPYLEADNWDCCKMFLPGNGFVAPNLPRRVPGT